MNKTDEELASIYIEANKWPSDAFVNLSPETFAAMRLAMEKARKEYRETFTELKDQLDNGIKYDEKSNTYILCWTKQQLDAAQRQADEIHKKLRVE